jgi:hypothetical protein
MIPKIACHVACYYNKEATIGSAKVHDLQISAEHEAQVVGLNFLET